MLMLLEPVLDIDRLNNIPANRNVYKMSMRKQNSIQINEDLILK